MTSNCHNRREWEYMKFQKLPTLQKAILGSTVKGVSDAANVADQRAHLVWVT